MTSKIEKLGLTLSKEKLLALLKASNAKNFPICSGRKDDFVIIRVRRS
jgi:hypothetical protein